MSEQMHNDPHGAQPVMKVGAPLEEAQAVMIMLHGRGGSAQDILSLKSFIDNPNFAYVAPAAAGNTWYPHRFIEPVERNEPHLSSALRLIGKVVGMIEDAGVPRSKIVLLGFSQGACLSLEYAARNADRYGGVVALSGGLIGADGTPRDYPGSLDETPVFLGCSDVDFHIPLARVQESTQVMTQLGGAVTERIYPGMGHTINEDELDIVRDMMSALTE